MCPGADFPHSVCSAAPVHFKHHMVSVFPSLLAFPGPLPLPVHPPTLMGHWCRALVVIIPQ